MYTKYYFCNGLQAVNGISFGVNTGECFGLLGVNGAGKTTTFRMLTGDLVPNYGDAYHNEFSLLYNQDKFLSSIGYCPQHDSLSSNLTGRETLRIFALLKGVRQKYIEEEIKQWSSKLDIDEHLDKNCNYYSGGTKRKLTIAVAMLGRPPVLMMDEPTSGIDPQMRERLWEILTSIKETNQILLLTSHSMEECEVLCNRLTIMAHGQLACIGSIPHLKERFCQGFSVVIKLKFSSAKDFRTHVKEIRDVMRDTFDAELKDAHESSLHYHIYNMDLKWSFLFKKLNDLQAKFPEMIQDYTASETTLEEIFISFAKLMGR